MGRAADPQLPGDRVAELRYRRAMIHVAASYFWYFSTSQAAGGLRSI